MVRYALPFIDDSVISLRRLHSFRAEAGEVELVSVLYVLCLKVHSEQLELSARPLLPRDFQRILRG